MKKLILFLLPLLAMAQNPTNFPYGIKNSVAPTNSTPTYLVTQEVDGVHKKTSPLDLPISTKVQDSLDVKANISYVNTSNNWTKTGNDIYNNNTGNVAILTTPSTTARVKIGNGTNTDSYNSVGVSETISTSGNYNSINSEARVTITANTTNRVRGGKFVSLVDMGGFNSTNSGGGAEGIEGVARVTGLGTINTVIGGYFRTLSDINNVGSIVQNAHGIIVPEHSGALLSPFQIATGAVLCEQGLTTRSTNTANLVLGSPSALVGNLTGQFTGKWNVWSPSTFKNYFEGRMLLATDTDNGVDQLQVDGTISASPATTSNQVVVKSQLDDKQNTLVAGANITIDNTDPLNPVISATGGGGGSGDVVGGSSSTDNALARYHGTTGKLIQNSTAILDDSGNLTSNSFIVSKSNPTASNVQSGSLESVYYSGVANNNIVLRADATGSPNIRLQVDGAGAHIGLNMGGTPYSAVTAETLSGNAFIGIRGANMQSASDFTEVTTIMQTDTKSVYETLKGDIEIKAPSGKTILANRAFVASGGVLGSTSSSGNLSLSSTSNATKGLITFGAATSFDEAGNRFSLGTTAFGNNRLSLPGGGIESIGLISNDGRLYLTAGNGVDVNNGAFLGLFGNSYAADTARQGALQFGTGNTATGFISFHTGAFAERLRISPTGALSIGVTPTTSAGGFDILTLNSSTNVVEKVASTRLPFRGTYSTTGTATTTFTVTIGQTMANTFYVATPVPTNLLSAVNFYVTNKTTTTFDIVVLTGLTGAVAFDFTITP